MVLRNIYKDIRQKPGDFSRGQVLRYDVKESSISYYIILLVLKKVLFSNTLFYA